MNEKQTERIFCLLNLKLKFNNNNNRNNKAKENNEAILFKIEITYIVIYIVIDILR